MMKTFVLRLTRLSIVLFIGLPLLLFSGLGTRIGAQVSATPWTVFSLANASLPMTANALTNPGFETGSPGRADDWLDYNVGYAVDETGGRNGGRALQLINPGSNEVHGALQVITLNQTERRPLYFSGWSKAEDVTGIADRHYSIYLDIYYTDGGHLWGQVLKFDTGTHDWQFRDAFVMPDKPIERINVFCLLRGNHVGTAWFDDLSVQEVEYEVLVFDDIIVTDPSVPPAFGDPELSLATTDDLTLTLAADGGAVTRVMLGDTAVQDDRRTFASGFFLRDLADESDFTHVAGSLTQNGDMITHTSTITALNLEFEATYSAVLPDRIEIHAEIADTRPISASERAVTLYFALPISATNWTWGDDVRTNRTVTGIDEFANFRQYAGIGATGYLSRYPWASLSGQYGGLALGVPLDSPRAMRLIHNPTTNQFYAAFDLGLSSQTKVPSRASVDLMLYRFDGNWGFRSAAKAYYERFPHAFARHIPPQQEGIWVAFSDLSLIPDIDDFGIAFHEINNLELVPFDEANGILSFRYIAEPWSHWLRLDNPDVDPENYDQVIAYLQSFCARGHQNACATLSSGFFDENGLYRYESLEEVPWCSGLFGCTVFTVNPDPDVSDATYPLNKAYLEWNEGTRDTYRILPELDGEYVDSFMSHAFEMDFRAAHFAAADTPLTFRTSDRRVGVAEIFATTEFARWLAQDVHENLGKWTMANSMLHGLPWGADLFDVMGSETNWLQDGNFTPYSDAILNYRRTLAFQRPYGLLMNTNFDDLSPEFVERYFQICLFYGIYPSMFSHNGSDDRYWDDSTLYERDRPLFKRYIPLLRRLNLAGWEPVTYATTSAAGVHIERFGSWPDLHFTLRNTTDVSATVRISLEANNLDLPAIPLSATTLLEETQYQLSPPAPTRNLNIILAPQASEILFVSVPNAVAAWRPADPLTDGRHNFTATRLADGRVLIVGGIQERVVGSPGLTGAEIYDPVSNTWNPTGSLNEGRQGHTATLLPNGRVLVAGGRAGYSDSFLSSVEIYNPISGTWSLASLLSVPRGMHSATRLADGRVLVAGGTSDTQTPIVHASAEIYDYVSGTWSPADSLNTPRGGHSATLLADGRVLVVGGYDTTWLGSAEIYDPASGAWSLTENPPACPGVAHTATRLLSGQVLVVGGACGSGPPGIKAEVSLFDPDMMAWRATTPLPAPREAHTATLLPDGRVLVAGGDNGAPPRYDSALIYDPANESWTVTDSLVTGRRSHAATLLEDGRVLVAGGWSDETTYLNNAELFVHDLAFNHLPTLTVNPLDEVLVGTMVNIPVNLINVDSDDDLRGLQFRLTVTDTTRLSAASNISPTLGEFFPGSTIFSATSTGEGWDFLLTDLVSTPAVSGTGVVVNLPFNAIGEGCTILTFTEHQLSNGNAQLIPHGTSEAEVCVTGAGTVQGDIYLDWRNSGHYTNTQIQLISPQESYIATTDPIGRFILNDVYPGAYSLQASRPLFVQAHRTITVSVAPTTTIPLIGLWAGDINQDQDVDLYDWYLLAAAIYPVDDPDFDLNDDGHTNIQDLVILANNQGQPNMASTNPPIRTLGLASDSVAGLATVNHSAGTLNLVAQGEEVALQLEEIREPVYAVGVKISLPAGAIVTEVEASPKLSGGFLNWHQDDQELYVVAASPEGKVITLDTDLVTIHSTTPLEGEIESSNIVPWQGSGVYLPIIIK